MSLLKKIVNDESIANETDSVGGAALRESGLYPFTVAMAYLKEADSGAVGLHLTLKDATGDFKKAVYVTSGTEKGGNNYYEKDGKKSWLPGYLIGNSLALLTAGKPLNELETEEKLVKVYNSEAKAEVPTKVEVITELLGQEIIAGIIKQTVDKQTKGADGKYANTGETRDENEIDKFFRASDKMTTTEIRGGAEAAVFYTTWGDTHTGKTRDRSTKGAGTAGAPGKAGAAGTPTPKAAGKSLFGA